MSGCWSKRRVAPPAVVAALWLVGCSAPPRDAPRREESIRPAGASQPAAPGTPIAGVDATPSGLEHVLSPSEGVFSGSRPETPSDFDSLRARGVRTILCVDGMQPNVAEAEQRGMRYVHLPLGYDGIPAPRCAELSRAVRDLPKPIYVHCHHGLHRGPAATAAALVGLGRMTPDQAVAWMKSAGTSPSYAGLFRDVSHAHRLSDAELARASSEFPSRAPVADLARAMSTIDAAWDNLARIRDAGWTTPPAHPDLALRAEATIISEAFREAGRIDSPRGAEFRARLRQAEQAAQELANAGGSEHVALERIHKELAAQCQSCHRDFRD